MIVIHADGARLRQQIAEAIADPTYVARNWRDALREARNARVVVLGVLEPGDETGNRVSELRRRSAARSSSSCHSTEEPPTP